MQFSFSFLDIWGRCIQVIAFIRLILYSAALMNSTFYFKFRLAQKFQKKNPCIQEVNSSNSCCSKVSWTLGTLPRLAREPAHTVDPGFKGKGERLSPTTQAYSEELQNPAVQTMKEVAGCN